jgi:lysophospholipase L1-like esterase
VSSPDTTAAEAPPRRSAFVVALDAALLVSVLAMPLSWFFDPLEGAWGRVSWGWKPVLVPLGLLIVRLVLCRRFQRRGWAESAFYRKCCFAILSTFVTFWAFEGLLVRAGVKVTTSSPIVITGEEHSDTVTRSDNVIADPELLWRFVPNRNWAGYPVNSHGFRTREFTTEKPAGLRRVIALGDSCTAQGEPPYSDVLHTLLQQQPPSSAPWEAFNMGVFGYSSMQGLRQFQQYGAPLKPDYVTLYFGWNDHWLYKIPDHLRMAVRMHPLKAAFTDAIRRKRMYTLLSGLARPAELGGNAEGEDYRVPHAMYRATLSELIREARKAGAQPLVLTAARRGLTEDVVRSGHARSVGEVERVHDEYVAITREVAAAEQAPLLDLAEKFAAPQYDRIFMRDGIHFKQDGLHLIAEALHAKLAELNREP